MRPLKRPMFKYGGDVKKQGIMHGMRKKKKRTKEQLVASRNESYGKSGSAMKKKGKINR